ncbi:MAG: globin domain-containing protein [Rhodomicrobium sp.]
MLSDRTIRTVKSTAPILRERGVDITRRMYERLFQDEQIKQLFNQAHHGSGSQPKALAGAVHAYATHIDRLADLGPMVERIAQKHVALQIHPEYYPYVERALLGALKDVLEQAATDEVLSAWTEAYEFLANMLMKREGQLYEAASKAPGGWAGWRDFTVDRVVPESENHAAVNGREQAMKQYLQEIAATHDTVHLTVFYEFPTPQDVQGRDYDHSGRITMEWLKRSVPISESDFYFCGPKGFMRMLALGLRALEVKEDRIHFEFFGPADDLYT